MSRKLRQRKNPKLMAFQNWIEGVALNIAIWLFRLIPVDLASYLMGKSWRLLAPFNARHKRARRHLKKAMPELSSAERDQILRGMWENLGRVAAETFHIDRLLKQDHRFEAVADEITEEVLRGERACLFVSFHSANWELCVQPAVRRGIDITGVYQALRNPEADRALQSLRQELYRGGLLSKSHQTARKILGTLKNGGIVAMMGDLREVRGIKVPFFDQMAFATPVPASLARSCDVPIVLGRVIRKKGVHFRIETKAIHVPVTQDRQADILAATAQMHAVFESWIRDHPEQWMWIHKKWAPPGKSAARKHLRRAQSTKQAN